MNPDKFIIRVFFAIDWNKYLGFEQYAEGFIFMLK